MSTPTAATEFFGPVSPFGTLSGWEVQKNNPTRSVQRAQALKANGDELAAQTYDGKENESAEYVVSDDNAAIPLPGSVLGNYHIDTVQVKFVDNDFCRMTVTGHKHTGGNPSHTDGSTRKYAGTLTTVPCKFGCPSASQLSGIFIIPTDAGVRSFTYNLKLNHVDEPGSQGNFLAGDNYDGSETADIELCDTNNISVASGWTLMTDGHAKGNTEATAASATAERHLQHVVNTGTGD